MSLWEEKIEYPIGALNLKLILRYPTVAEKAEAKRTKAAVLRSLSTMPDPAVIGAIEDETDRQRAMALLASDIEEHHAQFQPDWFEQVRVLIEGMVDTTTDTAIPDDSRDHLLATDLLLDHAEGAWVEAYFRPAREVSAGSDGP